MRFFFLAFLASCASAPCPDPPDLRVSLREPKEVFPAFQKLVKCHLYGKAYDCLSGRARQALSYEQFYFAFTEFEASRRLIATAQVHALDLATGVIRLCSPEFGVGRDFRLARLGPAYLLDFQAEDVEYFKERALEWHRLQVKLADGRHFAYPPDWPYAPLSRSCICGKP